MDVIEAHPPPVPPKDTPERRRHQMESHSASASKRKRADNYADLSDLDVDYEEHTPKRHRLTPSADDTSPPRQSTLRRKKGVSNLSNLNLRHEAERARLDEQARESKFQEGSLTDKPSQRPPSAFISYPPLENIDTLMSDYHDGMPTPDESVHGTENTQSVTTEQSSALYRFGQKLATSFRPVAMWNKLWNETKADLTQQKMEAVRKQQKIDAEKQYAQLKQAGHIPTKRSSFANLGSLRKRDSGTAVYNDRSSKHTSSVSLARDGATSRTESTAASDHDTNRTLRGRLHIKKPSITDLRWSIKRARSDANLFASKRESSASLSPVKTEEEQVADEHILQEHTLQKSPSKADLRKQQKLSKRVSDLETKLSIARQELNEAITEASPMPRYRYELPPRKFVPGALPSLPSERLLNAEVVYQGAGAKRYDDETIRASRVNYPRRAAELFEEEEDEEYENVDDLHAASRPTALTTRTLESASFDLQPTQKRKSIELRHEGIDESQDSSHGLSSSKKRKSMEARQDDDVEIKDTLTEHVLDDSRSASVRLSIDSTTRSLEPLYEEEEEVTNIPLNGDPSKPTALATPARFGRFTRSISPVKNSSVQPGDEEIVITRAAEAVRQHPGRQAQYRSSAKSDKYDWPDDCF